MTTTDHTKAIVEAAERWERAYETCDTNDEPYSEARLGLAAAVRAKRESERPKLLSADEAQSIYDASCGPLALEHPKAVQAVLDAAHARALAVIEALPDTDGSTMLRDLSDIRAALLPPNPMGEKP